MMFQRQQTWSYAVTIIFLLFVEARCFCWILPLSPCPSTRRIISTTPFYTHQSRKTSYALAQRRSNQQEDLRSSSSSSNSPRVRFSGFTDDTIGNDDGGGSQISGDINPLDKLLVWLASDIVSIVLGTLGLFIVVINRLALLDVDSSSADALTYETRSDLLAVFACGSVLLNGITKLDVTAALAESVVLQGTSLSKTEFFDVDDDKDDSTISWAMDSLLTASPAKTALLITKKKGTDRWALKCRSGVVPSSNDSVSAISVPEKSPILDRVGFPNNIKETYLPALQALPGRVEFTYLPSNTQLAVLIPVSTTQQQVVLILGSNTAKSFTPRDISWSRIVAERIGEYL